MALSRRRLVPALIVCSTVATRPPSRARAWQTANGTPWPEELRPGFIIGAERNFAASGMRAAGPSAIAVGVYQFESAEAATTVFPGLADFYRARLDTVGDALRPASTPDLGDEVLAYAGEVPTEDGVTVTIGLLCWREATVISVAAAAGLSGEQLVPLFTIAERMAQRGHPGRQVSDAPVATPTGAQDMHTGGVWDLLPTLADLPEGFVFSSDEPIPRLPSAQRAPGSSTAGTLARRSPPVPQRGHRQPRLGVKVAEAGMPPAGTGQLDHPPPVL
jgi:hypothetical protein